MPVELRRIDPAQNMRHFYALDIEADLFGGARLMKQFGRIGARGRIEALAALQKQAERKTRRGYTPSEVSDFRA
jgi:predicted DNA-binding WGR domain protein